MSKSIPVIGPLTQAVGSLFTPIAGGGNISIPAAPEPPAPPPPTEMPDVGDVAKKKQRQRAATSSILSGRAGTILSDIRDKLGG